LEREILKRGSETERAHPVKIFKSNFQFCKKIDFPKKLFNGMRSDIGKLEMNL